MVVFKKRLPPKGRSSTAKPAKDVISDPPATQAPAANTAVVLTYTGVPLSSWIIRNIRWSYSGAPTGGSVTFAWNDAGSPFTEVYYIPGAGPNHLNMSDRRFPQGATVTVTLAAGGSGVSGSLYADVGKGY